MSYIPNTVDDRAVMLSALGLSDVRELFDIIPSSSRYPRLQLPPPLSELGVLEKFTADAAKNHNTAHTLRFTGGGAYDHFIPAVVPYLASRGEFATSYTPYQPEVSQGTLQSMFEYQSMVADLLGMEVVNASHYDGATALAEAVLMSLRVARNNRQRVVCSASIHPMYRKVMQTYVQGMDGITIDFVGDETAGSGSAMELAAKADERTACVVVPYPDFFGRIPDLSGVAEAVHAKGALLVIQVNPIMLGAFRSPGSYGADIVVAEGQPLGIPLSFGGPYLGIFACRESLVRRMPGRLVGESVDRQGRRSYVLTLSTREQHIRREKATSNICTNQGLMALRAAIYLAALGRQGLKRVAELCYSRAHYAARRIAEIPGYSVPALPSGRFFNEFLVRTPRPAAELIEQMQSENILPGIDMSRFFPDRRNELLVCVTEKQDRQRIDALVVALERAARPGKS